MFLKHGEHMEPTKDRLISLGLYLMLIPVWGVVTQLLRAESTLAVYAGTVLALGYLFVTGWFTYIAFFNKPKGTETTDAE